MEMEAQPFVIDNDFFRNISSINNLPQLFLKPPEEVIRVELEYKQPGFLGEMYPISTVITKKEGYELVNILAVFFELKDDNSPKSRINRKASIVSVDSNEESEWSYHLYVVLYNEIKKLSSYEYNVTSLVESNKAINFCMKFREERRMNFEVVFKYTARKILKDGSKAEEFTAESKNVFYIDVFCPFTLSSEWVNPYCCIAEEEANRDKVNLPIGESIMLGVKITAGSFPLITIYDLKLKIKDNELVKDTTEEVIGWDNWPITLGLFESFTTSFCIKTLEAFNNRQIADMEILWSRADSEAREKILCAIPVPKVNAIDSCVILKLLSLPDNAVLYKEFLVEYQLRNTTKTSIEIKVEVKDNKDFFLTGNMEAKIIIPPQESEEIKFSMYPLKSGKLFLPGLILSMISGGDAIQKAMDSSSKYAVYVFS